MKTFFCKYYVTLTPKSQEPWAKQLLEFYAAHISKQPQGQQQIVPS